MSDHSDLDAGPELDLRPRTAPVAPSEAEAVRRELYRRRRRWWALVAALAVVAAGLIIVQFLRSSTLYFRNVDEAVAERDSLGTRRFRLQGRVIPSSVETVGDDVRFEVVYNCKVAAVTQTTDPPELFDTPWIPVVLEGHWISQDTTTVDGPDDHVFLSDRILVKHTNEYEADNGDRVGVTLPPDFFEGCDPALSALADTNGS